MRILDGGSVNRTFINLVICVGAYTIFHHYTQGGIDPQLTPFIGGFLMGVIILYFNTPKVVITVEAKADGDNKTEE